jgi:uncharacterized protein DUF3987
MPGVFNPLDEQSSNGSDDSNGQEGSAADDRTAGPSAEQGQSAEPFEHDEADIETIAPFPSHALPAVLSNQVRAIAELGDWPESLVGPLILAAASACLGRAVCVKTIKGNITYGNIFVLIAKQSGSGGSTAFKHAMAPIRGSQALNRREHETSVKPHLEGRRTVVEQQIENLRLSLRNGSARKSNKRQITQEERDRIGSQIGDLRSELVKIERDLHGPLFLVNDCTGEALAKLLANHGGSLAHFDPDAGDALGTILGKYQEREKASQSIWLKGYSGEDIVIGRKKEGLLIVERPCLSACFIATPERIRELFSNSQLSETGLLPRFLAVNTHITIKTIPPAEANMVRKLPAEAAEPYQAALMECLRVYRLKQGDLNEDCEIAAILDDPEDCEIDMTPAARLHLLEYFNDIAEQTRGRPDFFVARYIEQAAKLSLLHHIFSHIEIEQRGEATYGVKALTGHTCNLDLASAQAGVALQKWFVRRQAEFLNPKRLHDLDAIWDRFYSRMKTRPQFTTRDLCVSQNIGASEAAGLFSQWEASGWILPTTASKHAGPGRPCRKEYRLVKIFQRL